MEKDSQKSIWLGDYNFGALAIMTETKLNGLNHVIN